MKVQSLTKYNLILEVVPGFNAYDFFREFQMLKANGRFPAVKGLFKLEPKTEELKQITEKDGITSQDIDVGMY